MRYLDSALQRKVCMLGAFGVGKTSLVEQLLRGAFEEKQRPTVGVRIDRHAIDIGDTEVRLVIWNLHGGPSAGGPSGAASAEDEFHRVARSYLRGAAGHVLVVDGTREPTLKAALQLWHSATGSERPVGHTPAVLLLNKSDLADSWRVDRKSADELAARGWKVIRTSARTGEGVEEGFRTLAEAILKLKSAPRPERKRR